MISPSWLPSTFCPVVERLWQDGDGADGCYPCQDGLNAEHDAAGGQYHDATATGGLRPDRPARADAPAPCCGSFHGR